MSFRFRGKRRGPRAALGACALIAALLGVSAQSASASVPCPSGGTIMSEWLTIHEARGVTLCEGLEPLSRSGASGYLQIVDLRAGAGIQLQARGEFGEPEEPQAYDGEPYGLFFKSTAHSWYDSVNESERSRNREFEFPEPEKLFSVTNATLFDSVNNEGVKTTMTLPMETWWGYGSSGTSMKAGCRDPIYSAPKKGLEIEEPHKVRITSFRDHYRQEDVYALEHPNEMGWVWNESALVGLTPEYRVGGATRRAYLGVYEEVVYIFTSTATYTNADTAAIMQEIAPGMEVIQLDGGDSTQFYSRYAEVRSSASLSERQVPDVIAVYTAE